MPKLERDMPRDLDWSTMREIGQLLSISEGSVRQRMHRARKLLKGRLTGDAEA